MQQALADTPAYEIFSGFILNLLPVPPRLCSGKELLLCSHRCGVILRTSVNMHIANMMQAVGSDRFRSAHGDQTICHQNCSRICFVGDICIRQMLTYQQTKPHSSVAAPLACFMQMDGYTLNEIKTITTKYIPQGDITNECTRQGNQVA